MPDNITQLDERQERRIVAATEDLAEILTDLGVETQIIDTGAVVTCQALDNETRQLNDAATLAAAYAEAIKAVAGTQLGGAQAAERLRQVRVLLSCLQIQTAYIDATLDNIDTLRTHLSDGAVIPE